MYFEITEASYIKDFLIQLRFKDGKSGIVDLSEYRSRSGVFSAFQNVEFFKQFKVAFGTLVWGEGEVDIAPETLYEKAL